MSQLFVLNVLEANNDAFIKKAESLQKKARKLGGDLTWDHVGSIQTIDDDGFVDTTLQYAIDATMPHIEGWTFVARIDHNIDQTGGTNIVYVNPGHTLPDSYREAAPHCDHCGYLRTRKDTYVLVRDGTTEHKQIGRTCIREYIGIDPERMLKMFEFIRHVSDIRNSFKDGIRDRRYIDLSEYLQFVSAAIRTHGFVSAKAAESDPMLRSTKDFAIDEYFKQRKPNYYKQLKLIPDDELHATNALQFMSNLNRDTDFNHNLVAIVKSGRIDYRAVGYAAAGFWMYCKSINLYENKKVDFSTSEYLGTVGGKHTFTGEVVFRKVVETATAAFLLTKFWDGKHLMVTFSENDLKVGDQVTFKGRIKSHSEYQNVKQTTINYVKFLD